MTNSSQDEQAGSGVSKLQMQAMISEIIKLIRTELRGELDEMQTRLDRVQEDTQTKQTPGVTNRRVRSSLRPIRNEEEDYYHHSSSGSQRRTRRGRETRPRGDDTPTRRRPDDNPGGLKLKIPAFYGKNDPDGYLEWERKIDWLDLQLLNFKVMLLTGGINL